MNNNDMSSRGFLRTTEEIVNFIRIYRSYPCLWNIRSEEYKQNDLKFRAIREIADMYQVNVDVVKRKIHSLRCTYNKELKKTRDSKYKSNGEGPIYQTSLIWFNEMNFLQDIITPRKISDIESSVYVRASPQFQTVDYSDSQDYNDSVEWQDSQEFQDAEDIKDAQYSIVSSELEQENGLEENDVYYSELIPSKKTTVASTGPHYSRIVEKSRILPYGRPTQSSEEFNIFGASVAAQLREMDLCLAVETMAELQAILSRKRIQDIHAKRRKSNSNENRSPSLEPQSSTIST